MDIISFNEASTANDRIDTLDATAVKLIGNQTVSGIKTFSSSPIVPNPTTDFQVATKQYVDDAIAIDSIDDLATYIGLGTVIVKDINRGGIFVSKTEVDIDPNTGNLYTVNGGTVFAKSGGGFWVRQFSGAVNAKWFGVSNLNSDNSTYLELCNEVVRSTGSTFYLPSSTSSYKISRPFLLEHQRNYQGDGAGSILSPTDDFVGTALVKNKLEISYLGSAYWSGYFNMSNITVLNDTTNYTLRGIEISGAAWEWSLSNIQISGFGLAGLYINRCYRGTLNNIGVYSSGLTGSEEAVVFTSTVTDDKCTMLLINTLQIQDTPTGCVGLGMKNVGSSAFNNVVMQSNGYGMKFTDCNSLKFVGTYFEDIDREITTVMGVAANKDIVFESCVFARATYINPIILGGDDGVKFDKCIGSNLVATISTDTNSSGSMLLDCTNITYLPTSNNRGYQLISNQKFYYDNTEYTDILTLGATKMRVSDSKGIVKYTAAAVVDSKCGIALDTSKSLFAKNNIEVTVVSKINRATNVFHRVELSDGTNYIRVYANHSIGSVNYVLDMYNGTYSSTPLGLLGDTSFHEITLRVTETYVTAIIDGIESSKATVGIPTGGLDFNTYCINRTTDSVIEYEIDSVKISSGK